jgi:hypothetical protein
LTSMTADVLSIVNQPLPVPSDSLSTSSGFLSVCGSFTFDIVEAYTYCQFDFTGGLIKVQSTSMADIGSYPATLRVRFSANPTGPVAKITFTINITDPCVNTILSFTGTIPFSNIIAGTPTANFSRSFAPATDTFMTNIVDSLCGPRVYTILETIPKRFITITPPSSGKEYVDPWTLEIFSSNYADKG